MLKLRSYGCRALLTEATRGLQGRPMSNSRRLDNDTDITMIMTEKKPHYTTKCIRLRLALKLRIYIPD